MWPSLQGKPTLLLVLGTRWNKGTAVEGRECGGEIPCKTMDKKASRLPSVGNQCGINHPLSLGWHWGALQALGAESGAVHHLVVVSRDATMRTAQGFSTFFS